MTRLAPRVAELLSFLVDHAGSVVSRADLQAALWPTTTVEYDDGLNFCVRQLRLALGDDAGTPRYIETLPRRGYRFIAPVTNEATEAPRAASRRPAITLAVLVLVVVAAVAVRSWRFSSSEEKPVMLAVLPLAADTAAEAVRAYRGRVYEQVIADAAAYGPHLRTIHPALRVPDPRLASNQQLLRRLGATHVLSGGIQRQGNGVRLFVELIRVADWRHVWADSLTDPYAFSGNSKVTADRIVASVVRALDLVPLSR